MVHTLRLDNYSTTPRKLVLGTNSSFGTESIKIERGAGWDGLNLTATWHIPGREEPLRVALLDGDAMDVPPEVTKEAKDGVLVLAGLASGVQRGWMVRPGRCPMHSSPLTSAAWRCSFPTVLCNSTLQSRNKS